jgi:hypothetical protein
MLLQCVGLDKASYSLKPRRRTVRSGPTWPDGTGPYSRSHW